MLILGLLLFVGLVVVHEFGHFIVARRNGVDVEEFGVGFPPKAKTLFTDKKGTEYTLNWLPLGGFVRLKGEHDQDSEKGTFGAATFWAKTKIILAGVVMNLVTAWIIFSFLALVGIPRLPLPGGEAQFTVASDTKILRNDIFVGYVEPSGPADQAGVKAGDKILGLLAQQDVLGDTGCDNGSEDGTCRQKTIVAATDLRKETERLLASGETNPILQVERGGQVLNIATTPRTLQEVTDSEQTDTPKGYLGVQPYDYTVQRSTWSAPIVGAGLIAQFSKLTYQG